jgi:hypothetical protein
MAEQNIIIPTETREYNSVVEPEIYIKGLVFNGRQIEEAVCAEIRVGFDIDIEKVKSGIIGLKLHNVKGPDHLKVDLMWYNTIKDEPEYISILVSIDWEKALLDNYTRMGSVGIDTIQINMECVESGSSFTSTLLQLDRIKITKIDINVSYM